MLMNSGSLNSSSRIRPLKLSTKAFWVGLRHGLVPLDPGLAAPGAALYAELCQGCHLPPLQSKAFWSGPWWKQIDGKGDWYVDLYQIPLEEIGTDPGQAMGMQTRTVKVPESLRDKVTSPSFGPALGQLVEAVTNG